MSKERRSNKPLERKLKQVLRIVRAPRGLKHMVRFMWAEQQMRKGARGGDIFRRDPSSVDPVVKEFHSNN